MMKLINQKKGSEPHVLILATRKGDLHGRMIEKIEGRVKRKVAGIPQSLLRHRNEGPDLGIKREIDLDPVMLIEKIALDLVMLIGKIALNPAMLIGKIVPSHVMPI